MSFKEIKDERLELQKYKAGYETFKILIWMNFAVAIILIYIFDKQNSIVNIILIPCFAGLWIYEFKAQEAIEYDEEQTALKATAQRRKWMVIIRNVVIFAVLMSLQDFFLSENQREIWQSIRYGLIAGFGMGIFEYFRMKHVLKKANEGENV